MEYIRQVTILFNRKLSTYDRENLENLLNDEVAKYRHRLLEVDYKISSFRFKLGGTRLDIDSTIDAFRFRFGGEITSKLIY